MRVRRCGAWLAGFFLWAGLLAAPVLAADKAVTIAGFAFDPGTVTVAVGDSVTWTNRDGRSHTATATDGSFDTGAISTGSSEAVTFTTPGSFAYRCSVHPDMTGRVVVTAAAATAPPTDTVGPAAGGAGGIDGAAVLAVALAATLAGVAALRRARPRAEASAACADPR